MKVNKTSVESVLAGLPVYYVERRSAQTVEERDDPRTLWSVHGLDDLYREIDKKMPEIKQKIGWKEPADKTEVLDLSSTDPENPPLA